MVRPNSGPPLPAQATMGASGQLAQGTAQPTFNPAQPATNSITTQRIASSNPTTQFVPAYNPMPPQPAAVQPATFLQMVAPPKPQPSPAPGPVAPPTLAPVPVPTSPSILEVPKEEAPAGDNQFPLNTSVPDWPKLPMPNSNVQGPKTFENPGEQVLPKAETDTNPAARLDSPRKSGTNGTTVSMQKQDLPSATVKDVEEPTVENSVKSGPPPLKDVPPMSEIKPPVTLPPIPTLPDAPPLQPQPPVSVLPETPKVIVREEVIPRPAPLPPETALVHAVRALQQNQPQEMLDALKVYDPVTQEFLTNELQPLLRIADGGIRAISPEEAALLVDRLSMALQLLKPKAALSCGRICYLSKFYRYGLFEEDTRSAFKPGSTVNVYFEVKNFYPEPVLLPGRTQYESGRPGYRVRLSGHFELKDAAGRTVFTEQDTNGRDLRYASSHLTPPQDYYQIYHFDVPSNLKPGVYTLWIQVTDVPTGRVMKRPIEFRIAG